MGEKIVLKAQVRSEQGRAVKKIRQNGFLPAVIYGPKAKNQMIKVKSQDFLKVLGQTGENTLFDLIIGKSQPVKVLVHGLQYDSLRDKIIHIDFYQVDMTKPITTEIPLDFVGTSPAVHNLGGILVKNMDKIEIECLPQDLVNSIKVDLAPLVGFGDYIRIADINFPKGIKPLAAADEVVATVVRPALEKSESQGAKVEAEAGQEEETKKEAKEKPKEENK